MFINLTRHASYIISLFIYLKKEPARRGLFNSCFEIKATEN